MLRRLLLTGFEPFGDVKVNPSWECVRALDGETWGGKVQVRAIRLPVSFDRAPARLREEIEAFRPDAVAMFGVAAERREISLERTARNRCEAKLPDNDGASRTGPIDPSGPAARASTLPLERIRRAVEKAGVPVGWSDDAGGYLCNRVFWEALSTFAGPAGFVHVPTFETAGEEALRRAVRAAAEAVVLEEVPLAVAQFAPVPGDLDANLAQIGRLFDDAVERGARLVVFPELATSGIALASRKQAAAVALAPGDRRWEALRDRVERSGAMAVVGAVETGFFNSAFGFVPGRGPFTYRKQRLYGHDFAWANPGPAGAPWETPLGRIAVAICHDVVYSDIAAASRGCDLVLVPTNWIGDSGPAEYLAAFHAPVLCADRSGQEDGIRFERRGGLFEAARSPAGEGATVLGWKRVAI